jgi:hypothetical protein
VKDILRHHWREVLLINWVLLVLPLLLGPVLEYFVLPFLRSWFAGAFYRDTVLLKPAFVTEYYKLYGTALAMLPAAYLVEWLLEIRLLHRQREEVRVFVQLLSATEHTLEEMESHNDNRKYHEEFQQFYAESQEFWATAHGFFCTSFNVQTNLGPRGVRTIHDLHNVFKTGTLLSQGKKPGNETEIVTSIAAIRSLREAIDNDRQEKGPSPLADSHTHDE